MIYLILKKSKNNRINDYQHLIIDYFKNIDNVKIKIIDLFFDIEFDDVDRNNDLIFFDKNFAYNNIDVIKSCHKSVILLENETVYFRKINKNNPINEQMAINHNFKIAYLNPKEIENTNNDYKILIDKRTYLYNLNELKTINNEK